MPRRIKLENHLSVEELEEGYRRSKDGVERSQWQIIWLLAQGKHSREIEQMTSYSVKWIRVIAQRYNADGEEGIGDGRHTNPGKKRLLSQEQEQALLNNLEAARAQEEDWNGPQVAAWMSRELGRRVYKVRGWEMLQRLGYSSKTPRKRHVKADKAEQEAFKKRLST